MSDPITTPPIHLREYLERLVLHERELFTAQLAAHCRVGATEREAHDKIHRTATIALDLQAAEYLRRLDELNHAHEREALRANTFISRELHDRAERVIVSRLDEMVIETTKLGTLVNANELRISVLEASLTWMNRMVTGAILGAIIAIGITVIEVILRVRPPWP